MGGALLSLLLLAVSARELSAHMHTFEILFLRSLVSLLLVLPLIGRHPGGWAQLRSRQAGLHLWRNLAHLGAQYAWILGIALLPLAQVFALEFTAPLWGALLAALLLGERLNRYRLLALLLGMAGVLIMLRPGIEEIRPGVLIVLVSALGFALANTLTKKIVVQDSPLNIIFWMTVIHLVLSAPPAVLVWTPVSAVAWFWVLIMALVSISAHFCLSRAFALADAMVVQPLDFLRLPLAACVGFLFYQERLDWLVMAGALVMFSGNFINLAAERLRLRRLEHA